MPTRIVPLNPDDPREDRIRPAIEAMLRGSVVSLPTETFYGLGADAFDRGALARINALKKKPADSPIMLLLADSGQLRQVVDEVPETFEAMAHHFWPGPLTLVLVASPRVPIEVTGGTGTVAVRVPGLALPRRLAAALGHPITGVSANLTGQTPCRTAGEVSRAFPEGLELILDGGPSTGGAPSTILDLTPGEPRILREGAIPLSSLRPFLSGLRRMPV